MQRVSQQIVSWLITKLTEFVEVSPDDISMSQLASGTVSLHNIRLRTSTINHLLPGDVAQIFEISHCSVGTLSVSLPLLSYDATQAIEVTVANVRASGVLRPRDASSSSSSPSGGEANNTRAAVPSETATIAANDALALSLRRFFGLASAGNSDNSSFDDEEELIKKQLQEQKEKEEQQAQQGWLWGAVGAITSAVTYVLPPHPSRRPVRLTLSNVAIAVSAGPGDSSVAEATCENVTVKMETDERTKHQSISLELARGAQVTVKNKKEAVVKVSLAASVHSNMSSTAQHNTNQSSSPQQQQQQQRTRLHRRWTVRITECRGAICDDLQPLLRAAHDFGAEMLVPLPMRPHRYLLLLGDSSTSSGKRARSRFIYAARCVHAIIQDRNRRWHLKASTMRDARFIRAAYLKILAEVYEDRASDEALNLRMQDLQQLEASIRHQDVVALLRSVALARATQLHVAGMGPSVPLPVNEDYQQANNASSSNAEKFSLHLSVPLIGVSMPLSFKATVVNLGVTVHSKGLVAKGTAVSAQFHAAEVHHERQQQQQQQHHNQPPSGAAAAAAAASASIIRPSMTLRVLAPPPPGAAVAPQNSMAAHVHFVVPSRVLRSGGRITATATNASDFFADTMMMGPDAAEVASNSCAASDAAMSSISRMSSLTATSRLLHTVGRRSAASGVMEISARVGVVDCRAEALKLAALELLPDLKLAAADIQAIGYMSSLSLRTTRLISMGQKMTEERKRRAKAEAEAAEAKRSGGSKKEEKQRKQQQQQQLDSRPVAFSVASPPSAPMHRHQQQQQLPSSLLNQAEVDAFISTQQPVTPTVLRLDVEMIQIFLPEFALGVDARELKAVLPDSTFERERRQQQLDTTARREEEDQQQQQQQNQRKKRDEEVASPFPDSFRTLASSVELQWFRVWHGPLDLFVSPSASSASTSTLIRDHIPQSKRRDLVSLRVVSRSTVSVMDIVVCGLVSSSPSSKYQQQQLNTPIVMQLSHEYVSAVKQRVEESVAKMPSIDDLFAIFHRKLSKEEADEQQQQQKDRKKDKMIKPSAAPVAMVAAPAPRPGLELSVPSVVVTCTVSPTLPGTIRPLLLRLDGLNVSVPPVGEIDSEEQQQQQQQQYLLHQTPQASPGLGDYDDDLGSEAAAAGGDGAGGAASGGGGGGGIVTTNTVLLLRFKALNMQLPYPASVRIGATAVTSTDDGATEVTVTNTAVEVQQLHPSPATFQLGTVKRLTLRTPGPVDLACTGLTLLDQAVAVEELAVRITPVAGHAPQLDAPTVGSTVHVALSVRLVDVPNAMLCPAPKIVGDIYEHASVIVWDAMSTQAKSEFMSVQSNVHLELNEPEVGGTAVRFGEAEARIVRWNPTKAASTLTPGGGGGGGDAMSSSWMKSSGGLETGSAFFSAAMRAAGGAGSSSSPSGGSPSPARGSGAFFGIDEHALGVATETIRLDEEHFGDYNSPLHPPEMSSSSGLRSSSVKASPPPAASAFASAPLTKSRLSRSALRGGGAEESVDGTMSNSTAPRPALTAAEQWLLQQQQQQLQQPDPYVLEPTAVVITQSLRPRLLTVDVVWDVERRGLRVDVSAVDENAVSFAAAAEAAAATPTSSTSRDDDDDEFPRMTTDASGDGGRRVSSVPSAASSSSSRQPPSAAKTPLGETGNNQLGVLLKLRRPQSVPSSATTRETSASSSSTEAAVAAAAAAAAATTTMLMDETDMLLLCVTLTRFTLIDSLPDPNPPVFWRRSEYPPTLPRIEVGGELTAFHVRRTKARPSSPAAAAAAASNTNRSTTSSTASKHHQQQKNQQKKRRGTQQTTTPALHVVLPSLTISNGFVVDSEDPNEHEAEVRRAAVNGKRRPGISYELFDNTVTVSRVAGGMCDVAAAMRIVSWLVQEWLPPLNRSMSFAAEVPLDAVRINGSGSNSSEENKNQRRRFHAQRDDVLVVPRNSGAYTVFAPNADASSVAVLIDGRTTRVASGDVEPEQQQQQQQENTHHHHHHHHRHSDKTSSPTTTTSATPVPKQRYSSVRLSALALDLCVSHRCLDEKLTLRLGSLAVDAGKAVAHSADSERTTVEARELELVLLSRPLLSLAAVDVTLTKHMGFTNTIHVAVVPMSSRAGVAAAGGAAAVAAAGFAAQAGGGGGMSSAADPSVGGGSLGADVCLNAVDLVCFAASVQRRAAALQNDLVSRHEMASASSPSSAQHSQQQRRDSSAATTTTTTTKRSASALIWYSDQVYRILNVDSAMRPASESLSVHLRVNSDLSVAVVDRVLPLASVHLKNTSLTLHKSASSGTTTSSSDDDEHILSTIDKKSGNHQHHHHHPATSSSSSTAAATSIEASLTTTCSVALHSVALDPVLSNATVTANFASTLNRRLAVSLDVAGAKLEPRWHHAPLLVWWGSQVVALFAERLESNSGGGGGGVMDSNNSFDFDNNCFDDEILRSGGGGGGCAGASSAPPLSAPTITVIDRTGSSFQFMGFGTAVVVPSFGSVNLFTHDAHQKKSPQHQQQQNHHRFPLPSIDLDAVTLLAGASVSSTSAAASFSPNASISSESSPSRAGSPSSPTSTGIHGHHHHHHHSIEGSRSQVPSLHPMPSFMPSDVASLSSPTSSSSSSSSSVLPYCTPLMRFRHGDKVAFIRVSRVGLSRIVVELVPPVVLQDLLTTAATTTPALGEMRLVSGLPAMAVVARQAQRQQEEKEKGGANELISLPVVDDDPLPAPSAALTAAAASSSASAAVDMAQLDGETVLMLSVPETTTTTQQHHHQQQQHQQRLCTASIPLSSRSIAQLASSPFLTKGQRSMCKARFDLVFKRAPSSMMAVGTQRIGGGSNSSTSRQDPTLPPIFAFAELITSGQETAILRVRPTMQIRNETGLPLRIACKSSSVNSSSSKMTTAAASLTAAATHAAFDGVLGGGDSNVPELPLWCQGQEPQQQQQQQNDVSVPPDSATMLSIDPRGGAVEMKISLLSADGDGGGDAGDNNSSSSPPRERASPVSALGFLGRTLGGLGSTMATTLAGGSTMIGDGVANVPFFFPETADGEPALIHEITLPSAQHNQKQHRRKKQQQQSNDDEQDTARLFGRWEEEGRVFVLRRTHPKSADSGLVVMRNALPSTMVTLLVGSSDPATANDTLWLPPCSCVALPPLDAKKRHDDDDEDGENDEDELTAARRTSCWISIPGFRPARIDLSRASKPAEPIFVDLEPAAASADGKRAVGGRVGISRVAPGWYDIVPWCVLVMQPSSSSSSSSTAAAAPSPPLTKQQQNQDEQQKQQLQVFLLPAASTSPRVGAGMDGASAWPGDRSSSFFSLLGYSDEASWSFTCEPDQPVALAHTIFGAPASSSFLMAEDSNNDNDNNNNNNNKSRRLPFRRRLHPAQLAQRVASSTTRDPRTGVSLVHFTREWWNSDPVRVTMRNLSSLHLAVRPVILSAEVDEAEADHHHQQDATFLPALLSRDVCGQQQQQTGNSSSNTVVSVAASVVSFMVKIQNDDDDKDHVAELDEVEVFCSYASSKRRFEATSVTSKSVGAGGGGIDEKRNRGSIVAARKLDFFLVHSDTASDDGIKMMNSNNSKSVAAASTSYLYVTDRGSSVAVAAGPQLVERIADSKTELLTNLLSNPAVDVHFQLSLRAVTATVWASSVPSSSSAEPIVTASLSRCIVLCRNRRDEIKTVTTSSKDVKRFEISGETRELAVKEVEEAANPRRMYASLPPTTLAVRSILRFVELTEPVHQHDNSNEAAAAATGEPTTRQLRERRALGCIVHVVPVTVSRVSGSLGLHLIERAELAFPLSPVMSQVAVLQRALRSMSRAMAAMTLSSKSSSRSASTKTAAVAPPPPPPDQIASATPAGVQPGVYLSTADFVFYEVAAGAIRIHVQIAQDMGYDDLALADAAAQQQASSASAAPSRDLITPQDFHFEFDPHTIKAAVQSRTGSSTRYRDATITTTTTTSASAAAISLLAARTGRSVAAAPSQQQQHRHNVVLYIRGSMHKFGMPVEMLAVAAANHYVTNSAGQLSRNIASLHELIGSPLGMVGGAFMTSVADMAAKRSQRGSFLPVTAVLPMFASEIVGRSFSAIASFASSLMSQQEAPLHGMRMPASPEFHSLNEHWAGFPQSSGFVGASNELAQQASAAIALSDPTQLPHLAVRCALSTSLREVLLNADPYFIVRVLPSAIAAARLRYAFLLRAEHHAWISGDTATAGLLLASSAAEASARNDIALCQRLVAGAPGRRDAAVLSGPEGFLQLIREMDPAVVANPLSAAHHVSLVALRSSVLRWGAMAPRQWPRFVESYCRAAVKHFDQTA